ncbi:MAG: serine protease [Acholeplasmataceae bacterium]|nr:serine protease [Acholeplasmataceae bacterium]
MNYNNILMTFTFSTNFIIWAMIFLILSVVFTLILAKNKKAIKIVIVILFIGLFSFGGYYLASLEVDTPDDASNLETINTPIDDQYYDQTAKSVVHVLHVMTLGDVTLNGRGSAVIVYQDDDYFYAITNYHVLVQNGFTSESLMVRDYLSNEYDAVSLVDTQILEIASQSYDLGLIRFSKGDAIIPDVEYSNLTLSEGAQVHSVGYPNGERTLTTGEFRGFLKIINYPFQILEHSSEINHGSSGGALLDRNGRLIGINAAAMLSSNDEFLTGYAIPIDKVLEYIDLFSIVQ